MRELNKEQLLEELRGVKKTLLKEALDHLGNIVEIFVDKQGLIGDEPFVYGRAMDAINLLRLKIEEIPKKKFVISRKITQKIASSFTNSLTEEIRFLNKLEKILIKEGMEVKK